METLVIRDLIPGKASEETLTPGRKFLQVVFKPLADEGYLVTKRISSRNFWDAFLGGQREDGAELNIQADPLFLSICEYCGINSDNIEQVDWSNDVRLKKAIGMRVKGELISRYVEGYEIPNSLSKISTRYTYSTVVLDGEDENAVFRNNGHVIIQDPEKLQEVKQKLQEISSINEEAREQRQRDRGVLPSNERIGTGNIVAERSLGNQDDILEAFEDQNLPLKP